MDKLLSLAEASEIMNVSYSRLKSSPRPASFRFVSSERRGTSPAPRSIASSGSRSPTTERRWPALASLKKKNGCPPAKKQHPLATSKPHGPYYMHRADISCKECRWTIPPTLRALNT